MTGDHWQSEQLLEKGRLISVEVWSEGRRRLIQSFSACRRPLSRGLVVSIYHDGWVPRFSHGNPSHIVLQTSLQTLLAPIEACDSMRSQFPQNFLRLDGQLKIVCSCLTG